VRAAASHTLGANLENLVLTGTADADGTGNALANSLTGNSGANVLDGGAGADTLDGGEGNDTLYSDGDDQLTGGAGTDHFVLGSLAGSSLNSIVDLGSSETLELSDLASIASLTEGDGSSLGLGEVQYSSSGGSTTLYIGLDGTAGADATVVLSGFAAGSTLAKAGNRVVANNGPTGSVSIAGTPTQGETLTASNDLADADGLGSISYQWQADGADIAGATGETHVLTQAEVGKVITVVARYTDGNGVEESASSAATAAVANVNDAVTGLPSISGTPTQGETLTADLSALADADGLPASFSYQWYADGTAISGATAATFVLTQAEVGKAISLEVGFTDLLGGSESATSAATTLVANVNDAPTGDVTISGTLVVGFTLQAVTGTLADADGLGAFSFQWLADGVAIDGATGESHVLTEAQAGKAITVQVGYTDGGSTAESKISAATAPVISPVVYMTSNSYVGRALDETIYGTVGNDNVNAAGGADTVYGDAGNDTLNGGAGADTLVGGAGNDTYNIDNALDVVTEVAGEGADLVSTSVTYALSAEVENLVLSGAGGAISGTGNNLANVMYGNASANTLVGLGGSDVLDGGAGVDTLVGGEGNDIYYVDNVLDVVTEVAGEGVDVVRASATYILSAEVENLTLTGSAAIGGTGNALANVLTGNSGANLLTGAGGNDTLIGGAGADTLVGGEGNDQLIGGLNADTFVMSESIVTSTSVDTIMDFNVADDTIQLSEIAFSAAGALGGLPANAFTLGTVATDFDDRIIYDSATGALLYDVDGVGGAAAVQFAVLANVTGVITATDFVIG
jgi:Ca2+-binding RTX toxin-like protein